MPGNVINCDLRGTNSLTPTFDVRYNATGPGAVITIAERTELDGATTARAISATFARRKTALPEMPPIALRKAFGEDAGKQRQWQAFGTKNRLVVPGLPVVVERLYALLWPATQVAQANSDANATWRPEVLAWV